MELNLPKLSLAYAKIVASPTSKEWSQVYNAGSLFAAISLTLNKESEESLPSHGKNILNNLEAEFFALEEKKLNFIKEAVLKSFENLPPEIQSDAVIAYVKTNVLYLIILGLGKVTLKRNEKIATLLQKNTPNPQILTASGYLMSGDTLLLQTNHFIQNVSQETIIESLRLSLTSDIAENLSPHVHEKEDGAQAAIILLYNGASSNQTPTSQESQNIQPEPKSPVLNEPIQTHPHKFHFKIHLPKLNLKPNLPLRRKLTLAIVVLLILTLIGSIIYTKYTQTQKQSQELYLKINSQLQQKLDYAKSLTTLNPKQSFQNLKDAERLITQNLKNITDNSPEKKKLLSDLDKIHSQLTPQPNSSNTTLEEIKSPDPDSLIAQIKNSPESTITQDNSNIYLLNSKEIISLDKSSKQKKIILTNNKYWETPLSLLLYQGNIYLLDQKNGLLKFVAGQNGYGKVTYFQDKSPNLSQSKDLAIDGSVWILLEEGKILKFTRGQADDFSLSGLTTPLKTPTKLSTSINTEYIYILDNGNSRLLKFAKSGSLQKQYTNPLFRQAKNFEILEKDQKAHLLSGNKIYQFNL